MWYRARGGDGQRKLAPQLLEEVYNLEDALLVGGFLNSLMRSAERVRVACLAQLVNVIAPITTNPDGLFRQTIYYPYAWALQCARGDVLDLAVESPTYDVQGIGSGAVHRCVGHDGQGRPGEPVHPESGFGEAARCGNSLARSAAADASCSRRC